MLLFDTQATFRQAFGSFRASGPITVLTQNDADGLAAGALFARGFERIGRVCRLRGLGRGENPWPAASRARKAAA